MLKTTTLGVLALAGSLASVACGSGSGLHGTPATMQVLQPVDDGLANKAQGNCWFKVKNRSSRGEEVRLWSSASSTGARTERLGELLIVTGAMDPAVRDARYYGCSLFEYSPGSPVVMMATASTTPVRPDSVIPYGFSTNGRKQLK